MVDVPAFIRIEIDIGFADVLRPYTYRWRNWRPQAMVVVAALGGRDISLGGVW